MSVKGTGFHVTARQIMRKRPVSQRQLEARLRSRALPKSGLGPIWVGPAKAGQVNDRNVPHYAVSPAPYAHFVSSLISILQERDPKAGKLLPQAFDLAWAGHWGQFRESGRPYIEHPLRVAKMILAVGMGEEEAAAALCHDLIEDSHIGGIKITHRFLREKLGSRVAYLVEGLTELGKEPGYGSVPKKKIMRTFGSDLSWRQYFVNPDADDLEFRPEVKISTLRAAGMARGKTSRLIGGFRRAKAKKPSVVDIFRKWFKFGAEDMATIILKLYDRLDNMRTLGAVSAERQRAKAQETQNVHARIADRLGMWRLKRELEDLCFKHLEPVLYREIHAERDRIKTESYREVEVVVRTIGKELRSVGLQGELFLEKRHIYELYQRMQIRGVKKLTAVDIWRINIVVPYEPDCFQARDVVHRLYRPVQSEIRDFINDPRPNGHRFLQSYVNVLGGGPMLIQVRDLQMQDHYTRGILSIPSGEKESDEQGVREDTRWIIALLEDLKSEAGADVEMLYRTVAGSTAPIVVYARDGKKKTLPLGSTPLDFARQVHRMVFLHADRAIVNGRETSLFEPLSPGDNVVIIIDRDAHPTLAWVEHVHTTKAAGDLRRYLRKRDPNEIREDGLAALDRESREYFLPARLLIKSHLFERYCGSFGHSDPDQILYELGIGERKARDVVARIRQMYLAGWERSSRSKHSRTVPYYLTVKTRDRIGLAEKLFAYLTSMGFNIRDAFPVYSESAEMVTFVLGVDVVQGKWGVWEAGEIQRMQIRNIAEQMLSAAERDFGNIEEISRTQALQLLRQKIDDFTL